MLTTTFGTRRERYKEIGWPALLPIGPAYICLMLRGIAEHCDWRKAVWMIYLLMTDREDKYAIIFRRALQNAAAGILALAFGIWGTVMLSPWIADLLKVAANGVALRLPAWPFTPITWQNLFTWTTFLHYAWVLLALAVIIKLRGMPIKEIVSNAFWITSPVVLLVAAYTVMFGPSYRDQTTDQYFTLGKYFPIVLPMETFVDAAGILFVLSALIGLVEMVGERTRKQEGQRQVAMKPSGQLPDSTEATSDHLRKAGLV